MWHTAGLYLWYHFVKVTWRGRAILNVNGITLLDQERWGGKVDNGEFFFFCFGFVTEWIALLPCWPWNKQVFSATYSLCHDVLFKTFGSCDHGTSVLWLKSFLPLGCSVTDKWTVTSIFRGCWKATLVVVSSLFANRSCLDTSHPRLMLNH